MASAWEQRFAQYVRRLLALRESSSLEVLPDLMPTMPVIEADAPDVILLRGERRWGAAGQVTSAAGNRATTMLLNQSSRSQPTLITVEALWVLATTSLLFKLAENFTGAVLGTACEYATLDIRGIGPAFGTLPPSGTARMVDNNLGLLGQTFGRSVPPTTGVWLRAPEISVVLPPGAALYYQADAVGANTLHAYWVWRERSVQPDEIF